LEKGGSRLMGGNTQKTVIGGTSLKQCFWREKYRGKKPSSVRELDFKVISYLICKTTI
jgi:hypothetical protein